MLTTEKFYAAFDRAGFLVSASWTPSDGSDPQTARVNFRAADADIFGGEQISTDYKITYQATSLTGLATGELITVNGSDYRVREVRAISDGSEMSATLSKQPY